MPGPPDHAGPPDDTGPPDDSGPPDDRGPPAFVDPPGRPDLDEFLRGRAGPWRVAIRRGETSVDVPADRVDTSRGGGLAEIHIDDDLPARHVTVTVSDELEKLELRQDTDES